MPNTLLETVAEEPESEELKSELDTGLSTEDEDGATGYTRATDDVVLHDQGSDHHQTASPIASTSDIARHPDPENDSETDLATEVGEIEREIRKVWTELLKQKRDALRQELQVLQGWGGL